ncbi:MAG: PASTA domain-containing protein [Planctomycetes bacterium]|nr:PASTA domain-containing protein [Planctomycetota bacterium]
MPDARARGGAPSPPAGVLAILLLLGGCRIPLRLEIQTVHVPNLVNGSLEHARAWAAGAGAFLAEFRSDFSSDPERPGSLPGDLIVKDQSPKAGTPASAGEVVSVRVQLPTPGKDAGRSSR